MTTAIEGPCSWPHVSCPCSALDDLSPGSPGGSPGEDPTEAAVIAWASTLLWEATGGVFGPCPRSVLPCDESFCGFCHNRLRDCGCRFVPEIRLDGPVHSVDDVVIDGVSLPNTSYRIDDYEWLIRLDGGRWPTNSDPVDPDGFRVDYRLGIPPPAGTGLVTGILACELAKWLCDDDSCRLPRRATTVTRQGLTVTLGSEGFGLPEVDLWVSNATKPPLAGAVHSPDIPHIRRVTWEATSPGSP